MTLIASVNGSRTGISASWLLVAFILAGLMGNHFPLSILNAHFVFGSIFSMLALQILGWGRGFLAGALVAAYTYATWNHPWAFVTMTAEAAAVGWLFFRRRITLVAADAVYWLFLGIPLGYLCFRLFSDLPASNALFLVTKQGINGIANTLAARLILTGLALRLNTVSLSFREAVSNLLIFFVLCPSLILLALGGKADLDETDRQIRGALVRDSRQAAASLDTWVEDRRRAVVHLAELAGTRSWEELQPRIEQTLASDANFLRIALIDREATVVAYSPMADELGRSNIGKSYADRPYLALLKQDLKPMLTEVVTSRFGRPDPIAIMAAPVVLGGSYEGAVGGILNFDRIRIILESSSRGSDTLYTLLDRNGAVIMTNRPDQKATTPFARGRGTLHRLEEGMFRWVPELPPGTSTIELWGQSVYAMESTVGDLAEWRLILEQPVVPFQRRLYRSYTGNFFLVFVILIASLALAQFLSRMVVETTEKLSFLTRDLPAKLASGNTVTWPRSAILETNRLVANFKEMAESLAARFAESRRMNEWLEGRVEERTEELRNSEEFLSNIVENIPAMVFIKDAADLRFLKFNRAGEELLGYSREELLGKSDYDFFPREEADFFTAKDREVLSTRRLLEIPKETIQTRHRGERILRTKKIPILDARGEARYLLGISDDITDQIRLQDQLLQAQKMESVGRLAGGVAHDFNNMLGLILGHAEMALDEVDPAQTIHHNLQEILTAAHRSADLTRQLLAFARKQTVSPRNLDLNETVGGMLKMLRRLMGEDIDLLWKPGLDLWPIRVDPSQIDQVLANLCVNARDAVVGVGKVTIETGNVTLDEAYCRDHAGFFPGRYVRLAVSDNGCGMEKEVLEHLFEPFFTTKELGKGTGLGLATVYGIVRQNRGFINVYSEPGQGTTFKIYLPRCDMEGAEEPPSPGEKKDLRGTETVLLVEDEEAVLLLAKTILERHGYRVFTAPKPALAIHVAETFPDPIHLLITDVIMPGMNGRDLFKRLNLSRPGLKCIFMSGYTANVIAHHGVLDEGIHFLQKPFSVKALAEKVREVLDASGSGASPS